MKEKGLDMGENTGYTEPSGAPPAPPPPAPPAAPSAPSGRPGPASDTSKILAGVGYLFWVVALIAILIEPYKDEQFVKFHAFQALAIGIVSWVVWMIPVIGWLVGVVLFVFEIICAVKAFQGQYYEVPVVYGLVKGFMGE
ncbi:MAG: hypothetical protein RBS78_07625 [Coriobacteriia bacterium]|nr:hypothetical protein [Coriobacteriia bacterium]